MAEHKLPSLLLFSFTFLFSLQYILKLPPEARLELLKASVARKTGIPMTHVSVGVWAAGLVPRHVAWYEASGRHDTCECVFV